MPRDIPIIFSAPMVLALLAGRKVMTRRLAWRPEAHGIYGDVEANALRRRGWKVSGADDCGSRIGWAPSPWQKVSAGDRLWVRETIRGCPNAAGFDGLTYAADSLWAPIPGAPSLDAQDRFMTIFNYRRKRGAPVPAIHMPMWASRLTLQVSATKIERLTAISEADSIAEGVERIDYAGGDPVYADHFGYRDYRDHPHNVVPFRKATKSFETLWTSLHGEDAWTTNPEVVALSFKVVKANLSAPEARAA